MLMIGSERDAACKERWKQSEHEFTMVRYLGQSGEDGAPHRYLLTQNCTISLQGYLAPGQAINLCGYGKNCDSCDADVCPIGGLVIGGILLLFLGVLAVIILHVLLKALSRPERVVSPTRERPG
jgi:hypothetical protein